MRILALLVFGVFALVLFDTLTNEGRNVTYVAREVGDGGMKLAFR